MPTFEEKKEEEKNGFWIFEWMNRHMFALEPFNFWGRLGVALVPPPLQKYFNLIT